MYDYFRRDGNFYNVVDASDSTAVRLGNNFAGHTLTGYLNQDRRHVDVYIMTASHLHNLGGETPIDTANIDPHEDKSDDEDFNPRFLNSIAIQGPRPWISFVDTIGTGWTAPDSPQNYSFAHEFQHAIAGQAVEGTVFETELFSAGAEAIGGNETTAGQSEFPYVWPITYMGGRNGNYGARSGFMAYLAYNFLGADTSKTVAATNDDLLRKWARSDRGWGSLMRLLRDDSCSTCATKSYFHPGGVPMDTSLRFALLMHNWRVASYANQPAIDEGQYGYPLENRFAMTKQVGAFQALNGVDGDDVMALPQEVTLSIAQATRDTVLNGSRSRNGATYPMALQPLGSEYWVLRGDASTSGGPRDLVIRVVSKDMLLAVWTGLFCSDTPDTTNARLAVSVVRYSHATSSEVTSPLWAHPEWAIDALPPQIVELSQPNAPLEFVVHSFGDTCKSVLLVLSLQDGHSNRMISGINGNLPIDQYPLHYQLELSLRSTTAPSRVPTVVPGYDGELERQPCWAPASDSVAYSRRTDERFEDDSEIILKPVAGGTPVVMKVTPYAQSFPDWSPRGDWISFSQHGPTPPTQYEDLYVYNSATDSLRRLTTDSTSSESHGVFCPNGQLLAYVRAIGSGSSIHRIALSGANDTTLVTRSSTTILSPRWSADGQWIHYLVNDSLYSVGAAGASRGAVVAHGPKLGHSGSFDVSPSGSSIASAEETALYKTTTCLPPPEFGAHTDSTAVGFVRLALRDTAANEMTSVAMFDDDVTLSNLRYDGAGTRIAYDQAVGGNSDVYLVRTTGNRAPVFTSPPRDTMFEGGVGLTTTIAAADSDGEAITYQGYYLPSGAAVNSSSGNVAWNVSAGPDTEFVVLRAIDGSGGVARRVARWIALPAVAPLTISDLEGASGSSSSVTLYWTAPGDDADTGTATQYDIRYSLVPITTSNWASRSQVTNPPTPGPAGTDEHVTISTLSSCTSYYFAVKTRDEAYNWSEISNVVHGGTLCGGGGGGMMANRGGGASTASAGSALGRGSVAVNDAGGTHDALVVEMTLSGGHPTISVCRTATASATYAPVDSGQVVVEKRVGEAWTTRSTEEPASGQVGVQWPTPGARRLSLPPDYELAGIGRVVHSMVADTTAAFALTAAHHTTDGDVLAALLNGSASLALGESDTLRLEYAEISSPAENDDEWPVILDRAGEGYAYSSRALTPVVVPLKFALYQNWPNPFGHDATIAFDLPQAGHVALDVLDLQGRLVARVVDTTMPAGHQFVTWDRTCNDGSRAPAGVYLYRLRAGGAEARRKLVVLP